VICVFFHVKIINRNCAENKRTVTGFGKMGDEKR
jgi:hypothetical protein